MKDPLVLRARFTRAEGPRDFWAVDNRLRRVWVCSEGVEEWFEVPADAKEIWLVISPYRHSEAYPLLSDFHGIYNEFNSAQDIFFVGAVARWVRRHVSKHPQYHWYFSIEVLDE